MWKCVPCDCMYMCCRAPALPDIWICSRYVYMKTTADAVDETRLLDKEYSRRRTTEVNSVDLCSKVTDLINKQSKDTGTTRSSIA